MGAEKGRQILREVTKPWTVVTLKRDIKATTPLLTNGNYFFLFMNSQDKKRVPYELTSLIALWATLSPVNKDASWWQTHVQR